MEFVSCEVQRSGGVFIHCERWTTAGAACDWNLVLHHDAPLEAPQVLHAVAVSAGAHGHGRSALIMAAALLAEGVAADTDAALELLAVS